MIVSIEALLRQTVEDAERRETETPLWNDSAPPPLLVLDDRAEAIARVLDRATATVEELNAALACDEEQVREWLARARAVRARLAEWETRAD
jgi:ABC-type transporter Mla subunit MlaD